MTTEQHRFGYGHFENKAGAERDAGDGGRDGIEYISAAGGDGGGGDGRFCFSSSDNGGAETAGAETAGATQASREGWTVPASEKAGAGAHPGEERGAGSIRPALQPQNCHMYMRAVEAHFIKHLISTIAVYNRTMTLNYTPNGIFIDEIDSTMRTIIHAELKRERFGVGAFYTSDEIPVTVSMPKLYKHARSVKKKDTVEMFLDKTLELTVRTRQPSAQRHHETTMRVQASQCQQTNYPADFDGPVVVVANDLQKMCKDIDVRSGQSVTITALESGAVEFTSSELNGFVKTRTTLGDLSGSAFSQSGAAGGGGGGAPTGFQPFTRTYDPDQIRNLMRMTPLSGQVRIYMKPGNYIRFSTDIGTYGTLDIYHRSNDGGAYEDVAV